MLSPTRVVSRYEFAGREPGATVSLGWDAPLGTYFIQVKSGEGGEPLLWRGGRYGECPEPGPLLALARRWSDAVPDGLLARLLADEAADPAHPRRPWLIG